MHVIRWYGNRKARDLVFVRATRMRTFVVAHDVGSQRPGVVGNRRDPSLSIGCDLATDASG